MMFGKSLGEIANSHGTDKGTVGPSVKWPGNNYADFYQAYLESIRSAPIRILEIGLGVTGEHIEETAIAHGRNATGGGSLKMWYEYFPNAAIYGIDINAAPHLDNDRIKTFVADQGNVLELQAFVDATGDAPFDVIIDDGSHKPDHQQITLGYFFKKLRNGGWYFIEDLYENGLGDFKGPPKGNASNNVKNTRNVLKSFRETGRFLEPNALLEPAYLAEHIDYCVFHNPSKPRTSQLMSKPIRQLLGKRIYLPGYIPNSELLCAIRKK
jgi:hypothetical protein